MINKKILFFGVFLVATLLVPDLAFAQEAGADSDIWTNLADKAKTVGSGLTHSGYIIAGLGLIVFSFMAIFNKIKWSTLAYIMMSTFLLSAMTLLIRSAQGDQGWGWIGGDGSVSYSEGDLEVGGDTKSNPVSKTN